MASMISENWEQMDGHDCSDNFELSPRNHNLLMSLLDETQVDECDDESLRDVIRSLEAEIDSSERAESYLVDCESSVDESYGQDFSMNDLDLHWMDIEIAPTSPNGHDMANSNWYMDHPHHGQGNEFGWVKNYSSIDQVEQDCSSLWHETNASMID